MSRRKLIEKDIQVNSVITTTNSEVIDLQNIVVLGIQAVVAVNTPSAKTFLAGTAAIDTLTFPAFAGAADGDYVVFTDGSGLSWAAALDKTGLAANTPTGAAWVAVPAGRKVYVDVSLQVTATNICDTVRTALNALTGFTDAVTLSGTATVIATMVVRAAVTAPTVYSKTGASGTGSITAANGTAGVASKVSTSADTITITAHGLTTGLKGQASSTGTLPAGLSTSTDYFVVSVDANTIQLADSLAHALVGTIIDITGQGTSAATHTFTPTSIAGASVVLQKSNDYGLVGAASAHWDSIGSVTSISASGDNWFEVVNPAYSYARLQYTLTAGSLSSDNYVVGKE